MQPQFSSLDGDTGLEIIDPIEGHRYALHAPEPVSPTTAATDDFTFPVTTACRVEVSRFRLPYVTLPVVRDADDGTELLDISVEDERSLPRGSYLLDLEGPVKLYILVESGLEVETDGTHTYLDFSERTEVRVGARSYHSAPAETITVPDDPEATMTAISAFGSALKTTSVERSWPTLRGHPPALELGDQLDVPETLSAPETGITIRLPAEYEYVFPAAPLSYYLGAEVVPSETPEITTETGFVHALDTGRGFEHEVAAVLKQSLLFDCMVRTEGLYGRPLDERSRFGRQVGASFDFAALYEATPSERLEQYLSVPYADVADLLPTWYQSTVVRPTPESARFLPQIVDTLSVVQTPTPKTPQGSRDSSSTQQTQAVTDAKQAVVDAFKRTSSTDSEESRSQAQSSSATESTQYVPLPSEDAVVNAWVGKEIPEHGSKLLSGSFERDSSTPKDGTIEVTVVCNDETMREEQSLVASVYGTHEVSSFDVECHVDVSTDRLGEILAQETDLFHYIGHIDADGFECSDGRFDATTLGETGATTALLNACQSHSQGVALTDAGAKAVVVSLADVENRGAIDVGEAFAGLLNNGFDIGTALHLVTEYTSIGRNYIVVGNPNAVVTQPRPVPMLLRVESATESELELVQCEYPSPRKLSLIHI